MVEVGTTVPDRQVAGGSSEPLSEVVAVHAATMDVTKRVGIPPFAFALLP